MRRRALAALVGLVVVSGRAGAHAGHRSHDGGGLHPAIPAAVFLGSVLLLGTAVYLDHRGDLDRTLADVGVAVGVVGLLAAVALLFI